MTWKKRMTLACCGLKRETEAVSRFWEIAEEVRRTRFVWAMSQSPYGVGGALFGGEDWRSRKIVGRGM